MYSFRIIVKEYLEEHKQYTVAFAKIDNGNYQQILSVDNNKKHNVEIALKRSFKINGFTIVFKG
jgi:hypothetical protein